MSFIDPVRFPVAASEQLTQAIQQQAGAAFSIPAATPGRPTAAKPTVLELLDGQDLEPLANIADPWERLLRALGRVPIEQHPVSLEYQIKAIWERVPELHNLPARPADPVMARKRQKDKLSASSRPGEIVPWDSVLLGEWFADCARRRGLVPPDLASWTTYTVRFGKVHAKQGRPEPAWMVHPGHSVSFGGQGYPAQFIFPDGRLISGNDEYSQHAYIRSCEYRSLGDGALRTMATQLGLEP